MFYKRFLKSIRTSYKNKLTLVFSIGILIPVIFMFAIGLSYTFSQTEKNIEEKIKIADSDQRKKLDDALNNISVKLNYLTNFENLKNILSVEEVPKLSEMLEIKKEIFDMSTIFSLTSYEKLTIYTTNPNLKNTDFLKKTTSEEIESLCSSENIRATIEKIDGIPCLSVYKRYILLYDNNMHLLKMSVPVSVVFDNNSYTISEKLYFYYEDKDGNISEIIVSDKEKKPDMGKYIKETRLKNFHVHKMSVSYTDGTFYILKNIASERTQNSLMVFIFIISFLILAVTIFIFINILSRTLTDKLTSIIEEIETDDIKTPAYTNSEKNEFYKIHNKLYDLSSKLKSENEKILKYELELLSQKISPHFLYNNLSAIKCRCNDENSEEAIDLLSDYYRENFHKNSASTKLIDEKNRLDIYITLLKFAYTQDFSYSFEMEEEFYDICVLSDILQPLLENAFIHSINNSDEKTAFIKVEVSKEENDIFLKVSNNHFYDEDVDILNIEKISEDKKSAIYIIQKRIKLYYGENFGVTFEKQNDVFLALVKLPYIK